MKTVKKITAVMKSIGANKANEGEDSPYFIEVDDNGCNKCGAGRSWTVCGPDAEWLSTSYEGDEGQEQAEWLADILNAAYFAGRKSVVNPLRALPKGKKK